MKSVIVFAMLVLVISGMNQCTTSEPEFCDSAVKYRIFEHDWNLAGYQIQFYEKGSGAVAAFGVKSITDDSNIVVEVSGQDYNDTIIVLSLGESLELVTQDGIETYSLLIEDIAPYNGDGAVDLAIRSTSCSVKNRLFEADGELIGYHLQFYELDHGVVGAFGVRSVENKTELTVEASGACYDDTVMAMKLGETLHLVTSDESQAYAILIDEISFMANDSIIDVCVTPML